MQSIKSFFAELKNTPDIRFDPLTAAQYGLHESIMLESLLLFINKNKSRGYNRRDGRTWTYNLHRMFAKIFDFWSIKQVLGITIDLAKDFSVRYSEHSK